MKAGKNITAHEVATFVQLMDEVIPKLQSGEPLQSDDAFALDLAVTLRNRLSKGPKLGKLTPAEVEKARLLYHTTTCTYARISRNIGVSETTIKNALERKGVYASTAYDPKP